MFVKIKVDSRFERRTQAGACSTEMRKTVSLFERYARGSDTSGVPLGTTGEPQKGTSKMKVQAYGCYKTKEIPKIILAWISGFNCT